MAWVRELVSMIHLAKFTGAPASRAEELVAQIAATVEGLSALTWQEEMHCQEKGDHPAAVTPAPPLACSNPRRRLPAQGDESPHDLL
jgi:hypothetical protein